jgi:hypothetical protein
MARFVALKAPGAQGQTVHVNVDQIRILREAKGKTVIMFDDKHRVVVEGSADHIITLAKH